MKQHIVKFGGIASTLLLLTACGTNAEHSTNKLAPITSNYRTAAVILDKCLLNSHEFPKQAKSTDKPNDANLAKSFAVPIVEALVSRGVDFISNALKKAAEGTTKTISATATNEFYHLKSEKDKKGNVISTDAIPSNACIIMVQGKFDSDVQNYWNRKNTLNKVWNGEDAKTLVNKFGLSQEPDFVMEMPIVLSHNRSAMRVKVNTLIYNKNFKKDYFGNDRDLAVTLGFSTYGKEVGKDEKSNFAVGAFPILQITPNTYLKDKALIGIGTGWMPLPTLTEEMIKRKDYSAPYTLSISVTETKDASEFVKYLAGVFEDVKGDIKEEAPKIILEVSGVKGKE